MAALQLDRFEETQLLETKIDAALTAERRTQELRERPEEAPGVSVSQFLDAVAAPDLRFRQAEQWLRLPPRLLRPSVSWGPGSAASRESNNDYAR